jgi:hypothetical protein
LKKMERETGFEPATSSLGISAQFENKDQRRPWRCILTTANRPKNKLCFKTPSNGVNGVKLRTFVLDPSKVLPEPCTGSPNRAVSHSAGGNPCHKQLGSQSTTIVPPEVCRRPGRYLEAPDAQGRIHRMRPAEARGRPAELGLLLSTVRPMWPAGENAGSWLPAS